MIWGTDPIALQLLATRIRAGSQLLQDLTDQMTRTVHVSQWAGHDATGFATAWWQVLRPSLTIAAQDLGRFAQAVAEQATQQVQASTAVEMAGSAALSESDLTRLRQMLEEPASLSRDEQLTAISNRISPLALLALANGNPTAIGQLPGIDVRIRDYANRLAIKEYLVGQRDYEAGPEHHRRIALLDEILTATPRDIYVLSFDPAGDGKIAVSLGDPQSAKNVAVLVPGIGTELHSFGEVIADARRVRGESPDVATVAWLGYDPPGGTGDLSRWHDLPSAMREDRAVNGAAGLQHFMSGMVWRPDQHVSVLGHSYGSVVVMHAAAGSGLPMADKVVTLGSPGSASFNSVGDLALDKDQTFYTLAADGDIVSGAYGDLIPGLAGGWGPSTVGPWPPDIGTSRMPSDPGFGGIRVETDAWASATSDSEGHSQYYAAGSGGLLSVQAIVAGTVPPERSFQLSDLPAYERGLTGEVQEHITQWQEQR